MNEADTVRVAEAAVPPPGGLLAEARLAQNLTPADVARQLKLSVWQVEALEAGRYEQLPGPIFVRGFIRNYARLLKLDPAELVRGMADNLPQVALRSDAPPSRDIPFPGASRPRWPALAAVAAVIVGLLAAYEFFWNEPEDRPDRPTPVTARPAGPSVAPGAAQTPASPAPEQSPAGPGEVAAPPAITVTTAPQPEQDAPAPAATEAKPETVRSARQGEHQVRMIFDQESWVEIRDRNERIIFSQLNRPGTQQSVNGLPPFSIVVGNAHGVRMTFDDKPVDLARHTKIDVARLIIE